MILQFLSLEAKRAWENASDEEKTSDYLAQLVTSQPSTCMPGMVQRKASFCVSQLAPLDSMHSEDIVTQQSWVNEHILVTILKFCEI